MFPFCLRYLRGGQSSDREVTDIAASVIPFPVFVAHFCGRAKCVLSGLFEVPLLAEFAGIFCGLRFDDNIGQIFGTVCLDEEIYGVLFYVLFPFRLSPVTFVPCEYIII